MPKALDLNGKIFTHLKVLNKAPNKGKKTYWTCECLLCGSVKDYQTGHLVNGSIKSCGCKTYNNFHHLLDKEVEKECKICKKKFYTNHEKRIYCYECSPPQNEVSPKDYQRIKKRAIKHQLVTYKGGKCELCGYDKCEGALQFHHIDSKNKLFTLSQININALIDMDLLYKEVDKCQLLCANCHAEKHYQDE